MDSVGDAGTPLAADLGDAGDADTVDNLFLESTTEVLVGLGVGVGRLDTTPEGAVDPVALVVELDAADLTAGFGLDVLVGVAALRAAVVDESAAPRFSANVSALAGEFVDGAREVLRAGAASGFLVSSPEPPIDGRDLCAEVVEAAGVATVLAGFRTANPPAGRVGGLLRLPVGLAVAAAAEEAVGLVAEEVAAVAGRFAAVVVGRFGGTLSGFVPFAEASGFAPFTDPASASDATAFVSSPSRTSTKDSTGGSCGASASVILGIVNGIKV